MTISDFDVEARTGSRSGVVVLGIASAIAGVLAVVAAAAAPCSSSSCRPERYS
ncbi:hypothetical protein [Curtobacterium sp. VKM Ac-1393]|uniref:hypothetical protein n=1 Tax=Curtobacterium sp. VKM Ac-1393 TaxID=2783814 RepID=UPI00188A412B|nr:hypothetical protein [Curtobacterium sp. VKM Ac-1393]MBF4606939.1 hypothetical protein [Curtobacterium sp. VKM Ac-1393]